MEVVKVCRYEYVADQCETGVRSDGKGWDYAVKLYEGEDDEA